MAPPLHRPPPQATRAAILSVQLRRTPVAADVDLPALAARLEGYTGADLAALCQVGGGTP